MSSRNDPLPCPFCGGEPETDFHQGYRNISTSELGDAVAIYCTACSCHMSFCREDACELTTDDIFQMLLEQWNKRSLKTAPDASAPTVPEGMRERVLDAIPGNWLDPLLTGPDAVIPKEFGHPQVIEALLNAVRARVETALAAPAQKGGES